MKKTMNFNNGKDIIIKHFYPYVVFKSIVINRQSTILASCIFVK